MSKLIKRRGIIAVALVRLVPIAPFQVVNVVMGAVRIRLVDFVVGTFIGVLPGALAATVLSDQVAAALRDPTQVNGWLIGAAIAAFAALAFAGHRMLKSMGGSGNGRLSRWRPFASPPTTCIAPSAPTGARTRRGSWACCARSMPTSSRLQEVEAHDDGADMLAWLGGEMDFESVPGTTLRRHDGHYGNGLLTRCPVTAKQLCDLSWRGREPRGAIAVDVDCGGGQLRVVATHLGLRPAERRDQVQRLLALFKENPDDRGVLIGDVNEWFLWGRPLRRLHRHFKRTPSLATFPSRLPLLALDRIWTHPRAMLSAVAVHRTPLARLASDHLPLVATLEV